jgi:hypothetical protein
MYYCKMCRIKPALICYDSILLFWCAVGTTIKFYGAILAGCHFDSSAEGAWRAFRFTYATPFHYTQPFGSPNLWSFEVVSNVFRYGCVHLSLFVANGVIRRANVANIDILSFVLMEKTVVYVGL